MEEWKSIIIENQLTNYEISNFGRCRNVKKIKLENLWDIKT